MAGITIDVCYDVLVISKHVRTTVTLPADLVARADELVRDGFARSRGELLAEGLREELRRIERQRIDDEIRSMAQYPDVLEENRSTQAAFENADAETARLLPD